MKKTLVILCLLLSIVVKAQIISTIAGNGVVSNTGDGGSATAATINYPGGGRFDMQGNYYFSTEAYGNTIRKITTAGIISTVAGITGSAGFSGDNGPATAATLNFPTGVAVDTFGNLYIVDAQNNRVRKVDNITGVISTIAGTGFGGYGGDGGPATAAFIYEPEDICLDKLGNVYIADVNNNRIREIDTSGIITTVAGTGAGAFGGDGGLADTAQLHYPVSICFDNTGNLYISDQNNARIRKVDTFGIITTIAGNGTWGTIGDGGLAIDAEISPCFITFDKFENLYVGGNAGADYRVRVVNSSGIISTVVGNGIEGYSGDGGFADSAEINWADGLITDSCGNLYMCDLNNYRIRKITFPYCGYENVQNISTSDLIVIYPNPAIEEIHIDNLKTEETYAILNINGIIEQSGTLKTGGNSISILSLPPGMYFLELKDEEGNKTVKKIVKE